ncbi:MAG: hypothetical protein JST33_05145 [Actinobacteria bacterium]|nr:hypothetical protein [Actinomycetota bacterium]
MSTAPRRRAGSWRLLWLVPAGLTLLGGLDAGLLLLGLPAPVDVSRLPQVHGMLLAIGFVGTLIALERATALGRWYGYLAPALLGLGAVALVAPSVPPPAAKAVLVAGAAAFTLGYIPLWRRQRDHATLTQLIGAALALAATILWLGDGGQSGLVPVLPWLIGFIVLTIAAERVELARITMGPGAGLRLLLHAWGVTAALVLGAVLPGPGAILLGAVLLSLTGWLLTHDVARRTVRSAGVTRYMAACMLGGYVWLAIAGAVLLLGSPVSQPRYDAVVHAVFLGWTFSMIMAHATTILPAVLHVVVPYRPAFWAPAALLHLALIVRIWLGDGLGITAAWRWGGVLGVVALLLFALTALTSGLLGAKRTAAERAGAKATATRSPIEEKR